jgi:cell division protein FtsI/penicillin-binding protein 2
MEAIAKSRARLFRSRATGLALLLIAMLPVRAQEASPDLYAQATQAMLDRSFPSPQIEYVLLDAQTRRRIALRWDHAETPIPVGSLLKPFVALAYGRMENSARKFPTVVCHGKSDGCWRTGGHGVMTLAPALAESCNAYFLALARAVATDGRALERVRAEYELPSPPAQKTAGMLIGVTPEWRIPSVALARAYAALLGPGRDGTGREVIGLLMAGMKAAALPGGTASKVGSHPGGVLAKTGTAPCVADAGGQRCIANGDGLVVVMAPAESPRWVLLVRQRGTTGAHTAEMAGKMLASLEGSDAKRR